MGRVERRMYKRRRRIRIRLLISVLAVSAGILLARMATTKSFETQRLSEPTPTPVTAAYDTKVVTHEITLAQEQWYAIQTGVFSTEDAAREKAAAYTNRGAPGTIMQDGAKWRVFIACYGSEEEATAVRTRLGETQRVETYLYTWTCPELRLRLTGPAGQLDVVEAGLQMFSQTAARIRDLSILLDAAQMSVTEVQAEIASMNEQLALWQKTTESRFQKPRPELVVQLLTHASSWQARYKSLAAAGTSATELSAALKTEGMLMYGEAIHLRAQIGQ